MTKLLNNFNIIELKIEHKLKTELQHTTLKKKKNNKKTNSYFRNIYRNCKTL